MDSFGDHGAACTRTGELKRRGSAVERAWRPLWEEAPVQASEHPLVHDLVPTVPAWDGRQADVFVRIMIIRGCLEKDFFEVAVQNYTVMGKSKGPRYPLPSRFFFFS